MLFARDAGIRIGTIVRIKPDNIDTSTWTIRRRTKGGGQVEVPMTMRLREAVNAALALAKPTQTLLEALGLWAEEDPYRSMMRALQKAKKQAECRLPWTFHDLRRTKARELYDRSHDLRKVQALLGHRHMAYTLCRDLRSGTGATLNVAVEKQRLCVSCFQHHRGNAALLRKFANQTVTRGKHCFAPVRCLAYCDDGGLLHEGNRRRGKRQCAVRCRVMSPVPIRGCGTCRGKHKDAGGCNSAPSFNHARVPNLDESAYSIMHCASRYWVSRNFKRCLSESQWLLSVRITHPDARAGT